MYLSRFGVKNYKCLGDIDIPLTPIHVLIGQNDCGKTSLLEAMAAFYATGEKPVSEVFPKSWDGRELLRHAATDRKTDRIDLWGTWDDEPDVPSARRGVKVGHGLSIKFPEEGSNCEAVDIWLETNGEERRGLPVTASEAWSGRLELPAKESGYMALKKVLGQAQRYSLNPRLAAEPAAIDLLRRFRLDQDGFGLATLLNDILGFDPDWFISLRNEFCRLFRQFKGVKVLPTQGAQRNYDPTGIRGSTPAAGMGIFFEMADGKIVRAQQASDGAMLILALLALTHIPNPPSLLLLEEPENGIYPHLLRQVINILKLQADRIGGIRFPQIILTTHSPYVLSFFEPEEVTLLSRPRGEPDAPVRARPLRDIPDIRQRLAEDELYLGELWYNFTEEELFGNA
jgi:energy-coupling factor transporter ATP-binding protein EcfA2